ncbi:L,D-transpeptidase [Spirillospora albida]|uniref:L,D-transpeptidase n=1 Tax=Spirillospora albida TaxID=58123 RepID=UPI00068CACCE|nr:Ig-like domain-containing protein [Spirillospora albida]
MGRACSGPGRRGKGIAALAAGAAVAAGGAGCSRGPEPPRGEPVRLAVAPAPGGSGLRPDVPITVQAAGGTIENVSVATKGTPVEGELSADRTLWRSRWSLDPGRAYTVRATAVGADGRTETVTSTFSTARVKPRIEMALEAPYDGETVGVGMPIIMTFDREVTDRAAVERALEVRADKPVEGAWHWFGGDGLPHEAVFRTKAHWPANTKVSFRAHLSGVDAGRNRYFGRNHSVDFTVGRAHVSTISENRHTMTVRVNGRKIRTMPTSMGKGGVRKYTTTNGHHLTMDKGSPVIMDSSTVGCPKGCPDYYRLTVYSAVRVSDSGEYVHSAPWSVGSQGRANVSHGCINLSPSNARWFYKLSQRGDPVTVTGTSRELEPQNGWGYWQLGWDDWVKGSALGRSVTTGPLGDVATLTSRTGPGAMPTTARRD